MTHADHARQDIKMEELYHERLKKEDKPEYYRREIKSCEDNIKSEISVLRSFTDTIQLRESVYKSEIKKSKRRLAYLKSRLTISCRK